MTIRVDMTNKDSVPLYIETDGKTMALQPGESGTFYVKRENRIKLREDMRIKDPYDPKAPRRDRRREVRRFEDDRG